MSESILGKRELESESLLSIRKLPFKKRVLKAQTNGFLDEKFLPNDHIGIILCGLNFNKSINITYDNSTERISFVNINKTCCIISYYHRNILVNAFQIQFQESIPDFYPILINLYEKYGFISLKNVIPDLNQLEYIFKII